MQKNILKKFHAYARGLVRRHPVGAQRFMMGVNLTGDLLVATLPLFNYGSIQTPAVHSLDWQRYIPAVTGVLFAVSSLAVGRQRFALGHLGYSIGGAAMTYSLIHEHAPLTAITYAFSAAGGLVGAGHEYLEKRFGHSEKRLFQATLGKPKRLAGVLFFGNSIPSIGTALWDKLWVAAGAGFIWTIGNYAETLLPSNEEAPEAFKPLINRRLSRGNQPAKLDKA